MLAMDDAEPRRELVIYLNRLSDLLFVLARRANVEASVGAFRGCLTRGDAK